jgi:hypothetical protein
MTTMSKTAAYKAANVFSIAPGGVQCPHDLSDPDGPYTIIQMADDQAPRRAREMRAQYALELMGYDEFDAMRAVENAALFLTQGRKIFNEALAILKERDAG